MQLKLVPTRLLTYASKADTAHSLSGTPIDKFPNQSHAGVAKWNCSTSSVQIKF